MVLQRVSRAQVSVGNTVVGRIGTGLLVLLGVEKGDGELEMEWGAKKVLELRIFPDDHDKMNQSLQEVRGEALVVSQFTLLGDARKGRRPSYTDAADPTAAEPLYEFFIECLQNYGIRVERGIFAAKMSVELVNEGPVTLILEREPHQVHSSDD